MNMVSNADLTMELACLLSPTPTSLRDVAADFGQRMLMGIGRRIKALREMGFDIQTRRDLATGSVYAFVPRDRFAELERAAERYWFGRYGKATE
jgi:biotin operon repressor